MLEDSTAKKLETETDELVDDPALDDFVWGDDCRSLNEQYCQLSECASCKMSWPNGERSTSSKAACRCAQVKGGWHFGNNCG